MIQEIFPKIFHNEYQTTPPDKNDTIFYFYKNQILAHVDNKNMTLPNVNDFSEHNFVIIYLFSIDEKKYYLALERSLKVKLEDVNRAIPNNYEFLPVNIFRSTGPKDRAFAAITAYHLNCWYRDNRFCGRCGKPMEFDTKERMMHCDNCNNMVYPKICPAVIVAVTDGNRILLTKYAGRDYTKYALIAGFAEIGETIEQTVQREVMEEVGLHVKNIQYYKSQPWALSGTLLFGFFCELDGDDKITLQEDELSVGKWFTPEEMTMEPDDVSLTNEMMMKFKHDHLK